MAAGANLAVGVDLGTTYTCAAVGDAAGARVVQLTGTSQTIPSVVSITDGGVVAGEAAERRLVSHPATTAREFKRRLGDATPIVLGADAYPAEVLSGHLLREVLDRVERNDGALPAVVGLAHPASWGPFRLDLLRDAARHAGVDDVVLVPEPVAAAVANRSRVDDGSLVAVYDLGGGTFDAAVVRVGGPGGDVAVVGTPEGVERLGGIDFDQALMAHVDAVLDGQVFSLDTGDPEARSALMRLRSECQQAKEHLSQDSDVDIPVSLPSVQTSVRITRAEFESMVRPRLADSLAVFDRVVASAGATWDDIAAVLLVGGSSNIPVVAQTVGEHTGRPVLTATSPHLAIAMGTAMVAAATVSPAPPAAVTTAAAAPIPPVAPPPVEPLPGDEPSGGRRGLLVGAAVALAAVVAVVAFLAFGGGGDDDTTATTDAATTPVDSAPDEPGATEPAPDTTEPAEPGDSVPDSAPESTPESTEPPAGGGPAIAVTTCAVGEADLVAVLPFDTGIALIGAGQAAFVGGANADDCSIDPAAATPIELQLPASPIAATSAGDLFAVAGDGDGVIGSLDARSSRVCELIDGPGAMNDGGVVFPIRPDGSIGRVRTQGGNCSAQDDSAFDGVSATAVGVGDDDRVGVGGTIDAQVGLRLFTDPENGVDLLADAVPDGIGSVDAIVGCGDRWCVLDLARSVVHTVGADATYLGASPLDGTDLADAVAIRAAVSTPAGNALITAELADGTVAAVLVTAG